ncbi:MAG TPA: CusA/CzcA family heavy metal efflux RND transporter [Gemmatimonadota bacterium]|nr:CusA/CzcA family heavy metal efflux RND transporter [Gemmatimonadota bacterium]
MLPRVIEWSVKNKLLVLLGAGAISVFGLVAMLRTPVDAIPDLSDIQVIIVTDWPGQAPQVVEDQVTYPLSTEMIKAPRTKFVRGVSQFGRSYVYVVFEDDVDLYWARSRVLEYLSSIRDRLPEAVQPQLGPDATGVGWVYQYLIVDTTGTYDLAQLRSLQDWIVRFKLQSVAGVAEVATLGGFEKQYQVDILPERLLAYGVPVSRVIQAIRESNQDVGARAIELGGAEFMVRGRGYIGALEDIRAISVGATPAGVPITVGDVADVHVGPQERRGIADLDGKGEIVTGVVVMRYGENPLAVIEMLEEKIREVEKGLPEGVTIMAGYDRSGLIHRAIDTLKEKLLEESVIVALVALAFLLHARSALVAIVTLPLGILMAFIAMSWLGVNANIMSLGGIAIAIGAMIDAAIVMIENMHKHIERNERAGGHLSVWQMAADSSREVGPSLFFSLLIITVSFVPVFALTGQSGRLFEPLAWTKTLAMAAASLLSITLVPVLMGGFIRGRIRAEEENPVNRTLLRAYRPTIGWVLDRRGWVIGGAGLLLLLTILPWTRLGSEFMPPLNEGAIMDMPSLFPGTGTGQAKRILQQRDSAMATVPEVEMVLGKIGRAETATDAAPMSMIETIAVLKPEKEWRAGMTQEDIEADLHRITRTPGVANMWSQPIKNRLDMLATGIKTPVGIKVFGPDLATLQKIGKDIEGLLPLVDGTRSVYAERAVGGRYLEIDVDRTAIARYALSVDDVQKAIMATVGGVEATQTVEGRERYGVLVRYARGLRNDADTISRVLVPTPSGAQVPLGQLAEIRFLGGPDMIKSENATLNSIVFVDVSGRDIGSYVEEGQELLERRLDLPPGYTLEWSGQYQHMQEANRKLRYMIPVTVAIIFLLLFLNFRSVTESLIVMASLPLALVGGVWLMWALGYNLSVAAGIGFIALAGVAAEIGVVMLVYLDQAYHRRVLAGTMGGQRDVFAAVREGAGERVRPIMMTATAVIGGLLPILWGHGTGASVMKRIAAPMVGGMVSVTVLALLVIPALYSFWRERQLAAQSRRRRIEEARRDQAATTVPEEIVSS